MYGLKTISRDSKETIHNMSAYIVAHKKKHTFSGYWTNRPHSTIVSVPYHVDYPTYPYDNLAREYLGTFNVIKPDSGKVLYSIPLDPEEQWFGNLYNTFYTSGTVWIYDIVRNPPNYQYGISVWNSETQKTVFNGNADQLQIADNIYINNIVNNSVYNTTTETVLPNNIVTGRFNSTSSIKWVYQKTFSYVPAIIIQQQFSEYIKVGNNYTQNFTVFKITGKKLEIGHGTNSWTNQSYFPPTPRRRALTHVLVVDSSTLP